MFVQSVHDLARNGRHVLLVYDGYRSHMSLKVLELFQKNNGVVYAIPAHTSGKTQPLDVVVFGIFKKALRDILGACVRLNGYEKLDTYDFCGMLTL